MEQKKKKTGPDVFGLLVSCSDTRLSHSDSFRLIAAFFAFVLLQVPDLQVLGMSACKGLFKSAPMCSEFRSNSSLLRLFFFFKSL